MHIVHILTRMATGGSEENTAATCLWQVAAGHRVTLIHGGRADPHWAGRLPGVTVRALASLVHEVRPVSDARAFLDLLRLLRGLAPDVVHTHQSKAGILGRLAARALPRARVVHGLHILPADRPALLAAERAAARRTDLFLAVSQAVGASYVAAGAARAEALHCVRSGMDLARFRDAAPPDDWRDLLRLPPDAPRPPVALMLAAFEPRKRHLPFLDAYARLAPLMPGVRLLLAGSGPDEPRVRAAVQRLGLDRRVILTGHRPDPEALLALADVVVLASEREGLPRVAVQAAAAARPMVIADHPGVGEIVRHDRTGLVVADPAAAARAVADLLRDEGRRRRLADGARRLDLSDWALETLGARTTALYAA